MLGIGTPPFTPRTFAVPSCTRRRKSTAAGPSLNVSRAWTEHGLQKKDWRWLLGAQSELAILRRSRLGRLQKYKLCSRIERPARQSTGVDRSGWRVIAVSNACQQRARLVKGRWFARARRRTKTSRGTEGTAGVRGKVEGLGSGPRPGCSSCWCWCWCCCCR